MSYIQFVNFLHYRKKTFTFPEEYGLLLITGESGSGKTTILEGFSFAITGKPSKIYSHGTTNSCVTLYLKSHDMTIIRPSGANKLKVKYKGSQYEGIGAQGIINSQVCTPNEFNYGCYIKQKTDCSLATMTPSQQLEFVQTIAFDEKNEKIKSNAKYLVQTAEKKKNTLESKLEILKDEISNYDKYESLSDPLKGMTLEEKRNELACKEKELSKIKNEILMADKHVNILNKRYELQEKLEYENKQLEKLSVPDDNKKTEKTKKEYRRLLELEKFKENIKRREEVDIQLEFLQEEIRVAEENMLEEEIEVDVSVAKLYLKKHDQYLDLQEELEEIDVSEIEDPNPEYEEELVKEREIKETENEIKTVKKEFLKIVEEIADILNIEDIKTITPKEVHKILSIFLKENGEVFICPNCEKHIIKSGSVYRITEQETGGIEINEKLYEKLIEYKTKMKKFHQIYKKEIPESNLNKLNKLKQLRLKWNDYKSTIQKQENLKEKLQKLNVYSCENKAEEYEVLLEKRSLNEKNIFSYEKTIKNNQMKIKQLELQKKHITDGSINEENLSQEIYELKSVLTYNTLKQYLEFQEKLNVEYVFQNQKIDDLVDKIDEFDEDDVSRRDIEKAKKNVNLLQENSKTLEQQIASMHKLILKYVEKYVPYLKKQELEKNKTKYDYDIKEISRRLTKLYLAKEKCRQAEFLSIEETVKSINIQSKFYLDKMFVKLPIEVKLENYKPTGKGKNLKVTEKMNMSIEYDGNVYDSMRQLSGGESDRVNLAFILAINDMIGSKFLFLDESLSSLDAEINTEIFLFLKQNCDNRLIITVSHEVVKGLFDNLIICER